MQCPLDPFALHREHALSSDESADSPRVSFGRNGDCADPVGGELGPGGLLCCAHRGSRVYSLRSRRDKEWGLSKMSCDYLAR